MQGKEKVIECAGLHLHAVLQQASSAMSLGNGAALTLNSNWQKVGLNWKENNHNAVILKMQVEKHRQFRLFLKLR